MKTAKKPIHRVDQKELIKVLNSVLSPQGITQKLGGLSLDINFEWIEENCVSVGFHFEIENSRKLPRSFKIDLSPIHKMNAKIARIIKRSDQLAKKAKVNKYEFFNRLLEAAQSIPY